MELHFLDFDGDLYGEEIRVDVVERIRDVSSFDSVPALVEQIRRDVERIQEVLGDDGVTSRR